MPFALELTDDLDPTALATVALAIVTVVSVVIGWVALNKAQSEVDLSRREVEEAHRPVLIPVIDETGTLREWDAPTVYAVRPRFKESNRVVVPIKNIGSGPALSITVSVTPRNDAGEYSEASGDRKHTATVLGLGVSELMPVTIYIPNLGDLPNFDLWLTYADVARKPWVTSAKFLKAEGGHYTEMAIAEATAGTKDQAAP